MTVVDDAIAASLTELSQLAAIPIAPFGYGTDLSCVTDITETLAEVDPNSARGITEALIRRWTTPRGTLLDDPEYGIDLRAFANHGTSKDDLVGLRGRLVNEGSKDDRIDSLDVTVTFANEVLTVTATVTPKDPAISDFTLTFAIAKGEVMLQTFA